MHDNIISIVEMFSEQGHSSFSASYAISHLTRLLEFKPLSPLTGEDDEWWAKQQIKDEFRRILKASIDDPDPYTFIEKEIAQL